MKFIIQKGFKYIDFWFCMIYLFCHCQVKMQRSARMKKEIQMLSESPPFGISCWPTGDSIDRLEASLYIFHPNFHCSRSVYMISKLIPFGFFIFFSCINMLLLRNICRCMYMYSIKCSWHCFVVGCYNNQEDLTKTWHN
jgi:hypothetical protein